VKFLKFGLARPFPTQRTSGHARNARAADITMGNIAIIAGVALALAAGVAPVQAKKAGRSSPAGGVATKHCGYYRPCVIVRDHRPIVRDHRTEATPKWVPNEWVPKRPR